MTILINSSYRKWFDEIALTACRPPNNKCHEKIKYRNGRLMATCADDERQQNGSSESQNKMQRETKTGKSKSMPSAVIKAFLLYRCVRWWYISNWIRCMSSGFKRLMERHLRVHREKFISSSSPTMNIHDSSKFMTKDGCNLQQLLNL